MLINCKDNECVIIDIVVPDEAGIFDKDHERIQKYLNLRREVARLTFMGHQNVLSLGCGWIT